MSATGTTSLAITKPNGVVEGDVMIVNISQVGNNTVNPSSTGWLLVSAADLNGGTARRGTVLYKVATASEPGSYTFTLGSGVTGSAGAIVAFSGVDASGSTPFDASGGISVSANSSVNVSAGSITTITDNAAVIMFGQAADSSPDWNDTSWKTATSPGNLTELYDVKKTTGGNVTIGAAWAIKTAAGATGAGTATITSAQRNGGVLIALKPKVAYKSQIISANTGSTNWCPGETRNVSVTIKNVGTSTWTDGAGFPDINIGVKWTTNGSNWMDYYAPRQDAGNLAPGDTKTYNLTITASNNAGAGYTTPLASGANSLFFDVVYEGVAWFAWNNSGVGPGNTAFPVAQTILAAPTNKTVAAAATTVCSGTGTNITVALSEIGTNYQLRNASNVAIGSAIDGTGGTISLPTGNLTANTTFNVLATNCVGSTQMTGTATVTVNAPYTTQAGATQTFCIDNSNTITTGTVNEGQYVVLNVVKGFNYTFSVGDRFTGNEILTVLDDATNAAVVPAASASGPSGASITWPSSISGAVKIVLSSSNCANGTTGGPLTLILNSIGNTQDNQNLSGPVSDVWRGHVYNWTGGAPPGGTPSPPNIANTDPFASTQYVGYYDFNAEALNEGFGGNTNCFDVYSNGTVRTKIYTELFAVRYRMKTSKSGCYLVTIAGDDGVRLYLNGTLIIDRWKEQSITTYPNVLVNLNANDEFVLDYYENQTNNTVSFSIKPFDISTNTITPATSTICSGTSVALDGSDYLINGAANPYLTFQWESSLNNSTWTNTGVTTEDYSPAPTVTTYYRRIVKAVSSSCSSTSSSVVVNVATPTLTAVSQPSPTCAGSPATIRLTGLLPNTTSIINYSINGTAQTAKTGVISDASGVANFATGNLPIGNNGQALAITSITTTNTTPNCSKTFTGITTNLSVSAVSVAGSVSANQTICSGTSPGNITLTGNTGAIQWQVSSTSASAGFTDISGATSSPLTSAQMGAITAVRYYRAVVTNSPCSSINSAAVTVSINALPTISSQPSTTAINVCLNGTLAPLSVTSAAGSGTISNYKWYSNVTATNSGGTLVATNTSAATTNTYTPLSTSASALYYYVVVTNSNGCSFTSNISGLITVNASLSAVSISATSPQTFCVGGSGTALTATETGGGAITGRVWGKRSVSGGTIATITSATGSSYTPSGADLGSGTWYVVCTSTPTCGSAMVSNEVTVTVNANLSAVSIGTTAQTFCVGGSGTALTATETGGGAITGRVWGKRSVSGGTIATITSATGSSYTPSGADLGAGTWYLICTSTPTCGSAVVSNEVTVTVNANLSAVSIGTTAQIFCVGGSGTILTATETGGGAITGRVWGKRSVSGGTIATIASATGSSYTPSGADLGVGTWYVVCTSTPTCGSAVVSNEVTVTVNDKPTIAVISAPTALCVGASLTLSIPTVTAQGSALTGQGWEIETVAGNNTYATLTLPRTVAYTDNGKNIRYFAINGCGTTYSNLVALTVNALPAAPDTNTTQPNCTVTTGTITASSPDATSYILTKISDGSNTTNIDGIFSGIAVGAYDVTIQNALGCISPAVRININPVGPKQWIGVTDSDWNKATNWFLGVKPVDGDCISIPDTRSIYKPVINSDITVNSIIVEDYGSLTVNSDKVLTVSNGIIVGPNGSFVFENNSSLLQTDPDASNVGNITYKRNTTLVRRYDYTRWSSPVTKSPGFTLHDLSPNTLGDKYWSYTPGSGWTLSYGGGQIMYAGKGYNVRAPQTFDITTPAIYPASFIGTPNNGDIYNNDIIVGEWNLIGNPYPSALNADKLISDNPVGALYFWTHNTLPKDLDGDGIYTYTSDDYAIYTAGGGIGTTRSVSGGLNTTKPGRQIGAGQGFFVLGGGNIKFTNDMRIGAGNSQFFKTSNTSQIEKNRIWLNLTNTKGAFKQLLVGYIEGATNGWDLKYDAGTMSSNAYVDFYSINESNNLAIQSRAIPFANTDEVPLGYVTTIAGDFTISIDEVDGLFTEQEIYLEDKVTGKEIDLRAGNYTFTTAIGTFTDRFVLRYTSKTLGTGDFENLENGIFVSVKDKVIKVQSSKEPIKEVTIFDITGKLLYTKKKVSSTELQIPNLNASNEVLLVKVTLENGFSTAKKVIFQ
ncbi:T9SS sorting signal type C domain-containing protein [Flavobacterium cutihirudinis]|nr:T9SS sorting signal type C domain-containing protein [Flavobacterium cutihirudinis]